MKSLKEARNRTRPSQLMIKLREVTITVSNSIHKAMISNSIRSIGISIIRTTLATNSSIFNSIQAIQFQANKQINKQQLKAVNPIQKFRPQPLHKHQALQSLTKPPPAEKPMSHQTPLSPLKLSPIQVQALPEPTITPNITNSKLTTNSITLRWPRRTQPLPPITSSTMLLNRQPLPKGECLNSSLTLVSESRLLLYRENLSRTSEESIRHKVSEVIKSG